MKHIRNIILIIIASVGMAYTASYVYSTMTQIQQNVTMIILAVAIIACISVNLVITNRENHEKLVYDFRQQMLYIHQNKSEHDDLNAIIDTTYNEMPKLSFTEKLAIEVQVKWDLEHLEIARLRDTYLTMLRESKDLPTALIMNDEAKRQALLLHKSYDNYMRLAATQKEMR